MASIEYSNYLNSVTLCLTRAEAKAIIPCVKAALKKALAQEDKYRGIQEAGEASERQQTKLVEAEEKVANLDEILSKAKEVTK